MAASLTTIASSLKSNHQAMVRNSCSNTSYFQRTFKNFVMKMVEVTLNASYACFPLSNWFTNNDKGSISPTFYVLHAQIPKAQKSCLTWQSFFVLLGSACVKAARRALVKLTQGLRAFLSTFSPLYFYFSCLVNCIR